MREKTHRHFDASGRLPADFHVEEHDWVGHDDDFDSKKKECDFFVTTSRRSFPLPEPKKCPDTKKHTRENKTHTKNAQKKPLLSNVQKSSLQKSNKKKGAKRTLYAFLYYQCFKVPLDASHALCIARETIRSTLFYKMRKCVRNDSFFLA